MDTVSNNNELRNNIAVLRVIHDDLIAKRNAAQTREEWQEHDHAAKRTWQAWLKASELLTMRSNPDSYTADQKLGKG